MKTMKTNLGIVYDIEVMSIFGQQVEVEVRCEEGQKTFYLDLNTHFEELEAGEVYELLESEIGNVDKWVNAQTVGFIASEVGKICVLNSTSDVYWSFSLYTHEKIIVSVYLHQIHDNLKCSSSHNATGEKEIKELLTVLKGV